MRSGASRSAAPRGCTFSIRAIGGGAAQVYVRSHPTRIFMASSSWCTRRTSADNVIVARLFQPVAKRAVALPCGGRRRDVIDWAPEKRQCAACLFRRQTPEPKTQKCHAGLAAEI